jgi:uncharacterized protein YjgD (DUF1641 family)
MNDEKTAVMELMGDSGTVEERMARLEEKLDQVLLTTSMMRRQQMMLQELKEDLMPMANGMIHMTSSKLLEFEERGGIEFVTEGMKILERVVEAFDGDDVRALGDNIVHILMTVRNMTQPEILALANRATESLQHADEAKPLGTFQLMKAMREPEVKKGTGVLIEMLRKLGSEENNGEFIEG